MAMRECVCDDCATVLVWAWGSLLMLCGCTGTGAGTVGAVPLATGGCLCVAAGLRERCVDRDGPLESLARKATCMRRCREKTIG